MDRNSAQVHIKLVFNLSVWLTVFHSETKNEQVFQLSKSDESWVPRSMSDLNGFDDTVDGQSLINWDG